jgi:hypothetical protein
MEESVTYRAILEKGKAKCEWLFLQTLGEEKFGPPSEEDRAALEAITEPAHLIRLGRRLLKVDAWQELLATP